MTLAAPALLTHNPDPVPWRVDAVAERAIVLVSAGFETRSARLRPALARPPAHNRIAVDRLFSACESALRPEVKTLRHPAVRHQALEASALSPLRPQAANDNDPAPQKPSFMSRACSPFAPTRGGLQRLLG